MWPRYIPTSLDFRVGRLLRQAIGLLPLTEWSRRRLLRVAGQLPQAFTHLAMINAGERLAQAEAR